MLEKLLLGLLLYRDLSIYEIRKALDEGINQFFPTSFGALHPAMKRLEENALVTSSQKVERGRVKKVYSLEPKGRAVFLEWLEEDIQLRKVQDEGLTRVFFYKELKEKRRVELIEGYIAQMRIHLEMLRNIKAHHLGARIKKKYKEAFNYRVTTVDFGIGYFEFAIGWYEDLLRRIASGEMKK